MTIQIEKKDLPLMDEFKYFDYPDQKIELLVANINGNIEVLSSFCPHFGGPLQIKDGNLYCYFHDYSFDIHSKKCTNRKFAAKCKEYTYKEDNNNIYVEVN